MNNPVVVLLTVFTNLHCSVAFSYQTKMKEQQLVTTVSCQGVQCVMNALTNITSVTKTPNCMQYYCKHR